MSANHSARHDELIPAYVLGTLEGNELHELEAHLATGCDECGRRLALWRDGDLEELAASIPEVRPSRLTRERILHRTGTRKPSPWIPLRRLALPAAALFLFAVVWAGGRQARLGAEVEGLRAERDLLAGQVAALDRELVQARFETRRIAATLAILSTPEARMVRLAGLDPVPGAVGVTVLEPLLGRAVVWAFHLPAPAPGKTYQLWWIGSAGPVSAGTFDVDARGLGRLEVGRVDRPTEIQAWAVTLEPAGGVPQPTGAMVLKG